MKTYVWILSFTWAPDFPMQQRTTIHAIYGNIKDAVEEKEKMFESFDNKKAPGIIGSALIRYEVITKE